MTATAVETFRQIITFNVTFHINAFLGLIVYTELARTFAMETTIIVADVTCSCERLIRCGVAL